MKRSSPSKASESSQPELRETPAAVSKANTEETVSGTADSVKIIVAIGASAGGLEALEKFFHAMPPDNGFAFVVIQHLSPDHTSILPEIIGRFTSMKVLQVTDGTAVAADHVFIIPPAHTMQIRNGILRLDSNPKAADSRLPIDLFMRSLSEDRKAPIACILLSGTGSDGTQGLKLIKAAGGITMAQDGDARFAGMPESAIATGMVDFILNVEEMPAKLLEIAHERPVLPNEESIRAEGNDEIRLQKILHLVNRETGHDFSRYKYSTILRHIERRMILHRIGTFDEYAEHLERNGTEVRALFEEFLIGVTHFFRDPDAFETMSKTVISEICSRLDDDAMIRVWVPACSTGEEAYTLAILFSEHLASIKKNYRVQIFCTDIDMQSLEVARKGVYPENIASDLTPERLQRFFDEEGSHYRVRKDLRDMLVIAPHSIIKDPPFSRLDLVSCRNFLIYIKPELQRKLILLFHHSLRFDGFLFLGPSESLGDTSQHFQIIDTKWKIYRKKGELSGTLTDLSLFPIERARFSKSDLKSEPSTEQSPVITEAKHILLSEYAHSAVVINEHYEAIRFFGNLGKVLVFSEEPSKNLLRLAREELRLDLRIAIRAAYKSAAATQRTDIRIPVDGTPVRFSITVRPLGRKEQAERFYLVVFQESAEDAGKKPVSSAGSGDDPTIVRDLEDELTATRERLEAVIEEYETANEDLRSSNEEFLSLNEELQSSNEELETSREELQSLNEELSTVNQELQNKIEEVSRTNSDLNNLLSGTRIATLFLDNDLRIKRFTPQITKFFNLLEVDIGRSIADITQKIGYPTLASDCTRVITTLEATEREIRSADGKWYILRIVPYRTINNVISGAVVTFTDISALKATQEDLQRAHTEAVTARTAAETANQAKTNFLANMSHEVRTPLTGIIGLTDLAIANVSDDKLPVWLNGIREASHILLSIINDILDLSRMETDHFQLTGAPFNVRHLLDTVLTSPTILATQKGVALRKEIDPNVPEFLEGDAQHLGQIIANLVGNAVKFTDTGEIVLTVGFASCPLSDSGSARIPLLFSVRDTGMGIPAEKQQMIFEKFVQLDSSTNKAIQGTGLGLAISKNLVRMMNGELWVESRPGAGSTFHFTVSLETHEMRESHETSRLAGERNPVITNRPQKILLAEDNRINRLFLEEILRGSGHDVTSAGDGQEAWEILERESFDLVILDISMPRLDGFAVLERIRARTTDGGPALPVVALTAYAYAADKERILDAGFDAYLPKPIDSAQLEATIGQFSDKP